MVWFDLIAQLIIILEVNNQSKLIWWLQSRPGFVCYIKLSIDLNCRQETKNALKYIVNLNFFFLSVNCQKLT